MNNKVCSIAIQQPDMLCTFMESNNIELDSVDPITYETPLGYAIKEDNLEVTKLLLELGADPNAYGYNEPDGAHYTPLHLAKDARFTKLLLDFGADLRKEDSNYADALTSTLAHIIHLNQNECGYPGKLKELLDWIVENDSVTLLTYAEVFASYLPEYLQELVLKDLSESPEHIHKAAWLFIEYKQDKYHGCEDLCSDYAEEEIDSTCEH